MEKLNPLPSKRVMSTIVHVSGELEAFIIGGKEAIDTNCLVFDILNQKFKVLAKLNEGRYNCGAFKTGKYIYVFGGNGDIKYNSNRIESLERLDISSNTGYFK